MLHYPHLTFSFWLIVRLRGRSNSVLQNRRCVTRFCGWEHTTPISSPPTPYPACPLISTPNLQYIIRNESNFNGTVTVCLRDPFYSKRHIVLSQIRWNIERRMHFMGPVFPSCCNKQNCMCSGCVEINGERKGRFVWTCTADLIDFKAPVSLARHVVNSEPSGENRFSLPHNNHRFTSVGSSNFEIHTVTKTQCSSFVRTTALSSIY